MKRVFHHMLWFALIFAFIACPITRASAAPQNLQEQPGVDLVVILDQSNSMTTNDPQNHRIYTTQYLMDYLAFDTKYVNPGRLNRVAVIGIGIRPTLQLPLTPISSDEAELEQAKAKIVPYISDGTSFLTSLQMVREIFPAETDAEATRHGRKRMIIIISDGGPDDGRGLTYEQYFADIKQAYLETLNLDENHPLVVVGIDQRNTYWPEVGPLWQEFAQGAERVETVEEINRYLAAQLCGYLNPAGSPSECRLEKPGPHFVPPYARSVAFSFFKYQAGTQVVLHRPDGSTVRADDPDLLSLGGNPRDELYVISNPQAGCWTSFISGGEGDVDVFTQINQGNLSIIIPSAAHPLPLPLQFVFTLRNSDGQILEENADYVLNFLATLTSPAGAQQNIMINRGVENTGLPVDGRYISEMLPALHEPGRYLLQVEGSAVLSSQANLKCAPADNAPFTVFNNTFTIPVIVPGLAVYGPSSPHLQYAPLEMLEFGYVTSDQQEITFPAELQRSLAVTLTSPSGQTLDLDRLTLAENGRFTYNQPLLLSETGAYAVNATLYDENGVEQLRSEASIATGVYQRTLQPGAIVPANADLSSIKIELIDQFGNTIAPAEDYPLRLEYDLTWPNGETKTLPLKRTETDGVYQAQIDWQLVEQGIYPTAVRGLIKMPDGKEQIAFTIPGELNVSSDLPYFKIHSPAADSSLAENVYALHRGLLPLANPMNFEVTLHRGLNQISPDQLYIEEPNNLVSLSVLKDDIAIIENQSLTLVDGQTFVLQSDLLREPGTYVARFHFNSKELSGATESAWPDITVPFQRADPAYVLWTWRIIVGLLSAATLALAVFLLLNHLLLPLARGVLVAEDSQTSKELARIPLSRSNSHWLWLTPRNKRELNTLKLSRLNITGLKGGVAVGGGRRVIQRRGQAQQTLQDEEYQIHIEAFDKDGKSAASGNVSVIKDAQTKNERNAKTISSAQATTDGQRYRFRLKLS